MRTDEIHELVYTALKEIIREAKGTMVTVTPKKIAERIGFDTKPITLTIIRHYLEEILLKDKANRQGVWIHKTSHGKKYRITSKARIWVEAKR